MLRFIMEETDCILFPNEIETFVEILATFDISEIGCPRWFQQHERIYKLSLQASVDVRSNREEIVKEHLITFGKVPILVHELITSEIWSEKIFLKFLKRKYQLTSTVPLYMVLYNEGTIVSLLEAILFHEDVIETASDVLIDLIDYCYRKTILLKSSESSQDDSNALDASDEMKDLLKQKQAIDFEIGMKSISILSYFAQNANVIPLSALHRLLSIHDVIMLFTSLIYDSPWIRKMLNGKMEKYYDSKWNELTKRDHFKLSKVEGQVWISLIKLLLDPSFQKKYEISSFKKEQLLKLRSRLNDVIINQIPIVQELLRFLEHLSFFDAPLSKPDIMIEQIPEIREGILERNKKMWDTIAEKQMEENFSLSESQLSNLCKNLSSVYSLDNLEAMLTDKPLCAGCHSKGTKRCSRCKNEWYCGRQCQVSHWTKHKPVCDLVTEEDQTVST